MRHKASFPRLPSPAVLSPMAGVTDVAFRALCARHGAGMTYTEFVNSIAINRQNLATQEMLRVDAAEKLVAVQLFGSSVNDVVSAAQKVEDRFDVIDVNCGCPAWKVIKSGAGSSLLSKPEGIGTFINTLASAVSKPVTLKIRTGISDTKINAVDVAKIAEDAGAAAIAVHGRTQKQGYRGYANWDIIAAVKNAVNIPVIGNGDVFSAEDCVKRLEETGVDAVMIARGAIGNPGIFTQIQELQKKGSYEARNRLAYFEEYLALAKKYNISFATIKKQSLSFTKTLDGGAILRDQLGRCMSEEELVSTLDSFRQKS